MSVTRRLLLADRKGARSGMGDCSEQTIRLLGADYQTARSRLSRLIVAASSLLKDTSLGPFCQFLDVLGDLLLQKR